MVIAGGAWSDAFGEQLGVRLPVGPMRGQIAHLDLGETDTSDWTIVSGFRGHYLVPWDDNRVVAGATREMDAGYKVETTVEGMLEVLSEATRVALDCVEQASKSSELVCGRRRRMDFRLSVQFRTRPMSTW